MARDAMDTLACMFIIRKFDYVSKVTAYIENNK